MKQFTRFFMLFVAAAAFSAPSFAQKDVTDKVLNADCELGVKYWDVDVSLDRAFIWKRSSHTERAFYDSGFFGFKNYTLELWTSSSDGLGESRISQLITGLEPGTYVFGAHAASCLQNNPVTHDKDAIAYSYIFAGDQKVTVATENPGGFNDENGGPEFHSERFNVAATVGENGQLRVGFSSDDSYIGTYFTFDNASLYFFGDATADEALLQMSKIDVQKAIAIADTLKQYPMSADSLQMLNEAVAAAAEAQTVEELRAADDNIRIAAVFARRSVYYFSQVAEYVAAAKEVAAGAWSESVKDQLDDLNQAIAKAEAAIEAGSIDAATADELTDELKQKSDLVRCDLIFSMNDALKMFIDEDDMTAEELALLGLAADFEHPGFGDEEGQITDAYYDVLRNLYEEVEAALKDVGFGYTAADVLLYEKQILDAIKNLQHVGENNLPMKVGVLKEDGTPLVIMRPGNQNHDLDQYHEELEALGFGAVSSYGENNPGFQVARYESPTIFLPEDAERLRLTVTHTLMTSPEEGPCVGFGRGNTKGGVKHDGPFFIISEFFMWDQDGNPITLSASDFASNIEPQEGSFDNLVDGDGSTYFHGPYGRDCGLAEGENHYLEVMLPAGVTAVRFAYECIWNNIYRISCFPTGVTVSVPREIDQELQSAVSAARNVSVSPGTDPGFYEVDLTNLNEAIAAGEALLDAGSDDEDAYDEAIMNLEDALAEVQEVEMNLPQPGVEYYISSSVPFFEKQQIMKNMTVFRDSILWWTTAADDALQRFTFEKVEVDDEDEDYGKDLFKIKNVGTGRYLPNYTIYPETERNKAYNYNRHRILFTEDNAEEPGIFELKSLGSGRFGFYIKDPEGTVQMLHAGDHNNGIANEETCQEGNAYYEEGYFNSTDDQNSSNNILTGYGRSGIQGPILRWTETSINGASAWFIRPMTALPTTVQSSESQVLVPAGTFKTDAVHIFGKADVLTLTADKNTDFADLKVLDILGKEIETKVEKATANVTTVTLPNPVESFVIQFANAEGVASVNVSGESSPLAALQKKYDEVTAATYTVGKLVGDVTEASYAPYEAALKLAEEYLKNGATQEQVDACIAAIDAAIEKLVVIMPEEGKTYCIISARPVWEQRYGVEMAIFEDESARQPAWSYLNYNSNLFRWKFELAEKEERTDPDAYYISNVETGEYIGFASARSTALQMRDKEDCIPYRLVALGAEQFNIWNPASSDFKLHQLGHDNGGNVKGEICYWSTGANDSSAWKIMDSGFVVPVEDLLAEPEPTRQGAEGIFDLSGRRISIPTHGLYIINGKKVIIK